MTARRAAGALAILAIGCSSAPRPANLDVNHDACAYCRMVVSDPRFAAQVVVKLEEPRFFDDLGCLANYLKTKTLPSHAVIFVADHQTRAWVPAPSAIYTEAVDAIAPMGSHIMAHASIDTRAADPAAAGGKTVPLEIVFPAGLPRRTP
jgi:copper chaperone NosL